MGILRGRLHLGRLLALIFMACPGFGHGAEALREFDIPSAEASNGLSLFAKQANTPLLFLNDEVRRKRTNEVHGAHTIDEALSILLKDTGIASSINRSGVVTVTVASAAEPGYKAQARPEAPHTVPEAQAGGLSDSSGYIAPDVIVTAQFHEESLQRTPLAITAVSGSELQEKGYNDITGLGQLVPSVNLTSTGAYGGKTLAAFIRGVGASDYNFGVEPGVAFYLDDVYLGPSYGTMLLLDVGDLERIEVLRGPQGTLSGKNAIGGAVHLVSRKPRGDNSGYVQVEAGSYSLLRLRAAYDAPLFDDQLMMRISGYSSHRDGYVELLDFACTNPTQLGNQSAPYALQSASAGAGCRRGALGNEDVRAGRAALRWLPADNLEINLSGDYIDDESNGAADVLIGLDPSGFAAFNASTTVPLYGVPYDRRFLPPNQLSSYATFKDPQYGLSFPPVDTLLTKDLTLKAEWKIRPHLTASSISAYRTYSGHWSYDSDSSPLATDGVYDSQNHRQVTQELRLSGLTSGQRLEWTLGAFYFHGHEVDDAEIFAALYDFYIRTHSQPYNTSYAGYLHTEWQLAGPWSLIGGIRQTHEQKEYLFVENDLPGTPGNAFPGGFYYPARTRYDHFDYRIGLEYQPTADFMAYVNVSTGFRGGGFNPRPASPAQALGYGPERLTSYEIGSRNELWQHRVRFDNTVYFSHYTDIQLTANLSDVGNNFPDTVVTNAGTANIYGLESELEVHPTAWLALNAAGSYSHFRYTSLGLGAGLANGPTLSTQQVYTPTWKFNSGVQLTLPLLQQYGALTFDAGYSWRSVQYADARNSPQMAIGSYGLLNARASFALNNGWTVALSGTNLTNQFYYSAKNFISGNYQWKGLPGLPMTGECSIRWSF